jgi:Protein of unknown function (DUF2628)
MRMYTVHLRPFRPGEDPDVVLVKEGFSWLAFLAAPLWALWQRQWLALLAYGILAGTIAALVDFADVTPATEILVEGTLAWLVGLNAHDWQRWRLDRAGYRLAAVVAGRDLAEAERRFFSNWTFSAPRTAPFAAAGSLSGYPA